MPWSDGTVCHDFSFWMLNFKPAFSLYSFTFIKRLFISSLLSAIRFISSKTHYLRVFFSFFLSFFFFCIDAKPHQVEQINYLMTTSKLPQTYWNLRLITLTTCDNTLFPHHHPIRELCTSCLLALGHLSLTLPLKTLFWTPGDPWIWVFWARAVLNSLLVALH